MFLDLGPGIASSVDQTVLPRAHVLIIKDQRNDWRNGILLIEVPTCADLI